MRTLAAIIVAPLLLLGNSQAAGKHEDPAIEVCEYAMFQKAPAALHTYLRYGEFISGNLATIIYRRTSAGRGPMVLNCQFAKREGMFVLSPGEIIWSNCGIPGTDECRRTTFPWSNRPLDDFVQKVTIPLYALRMYPVNPAATKLSIQ